MERLHIDAKDDLVLRLAHRDQPVQAVIELIWNSLDAEAMNVSVIIERNALDGVERVTIEDDGHGMAPEQIPSAFQHLGGSWKATTKLSPVLKRRMNGANGQGRIRGFALGSAVSWTTVALDATNVRKRTVVHGRQSDPTNFDPSELPVLDEDKTGTAFVAEDPAPHVNRITQESARHRITATFALFLTSNPDVTIVFDGRPLDPESVEELRQDYTLHEFGTDQVDPPILRIIEWANDPGRAVHLCDLTGAVLDTVPPDIHTPGFNYTAYLLWNEFGRRSDQLLLAEMHAGDFADVLDAARQQIKLHFQSREKDRRADQVKKWKDAGDYPYAGDPGSEAERAEREAFDYVATTVARKIPKAQMARRTTLGLLKAVVATDPGSLPEIIEKLMPLPKKEIDDLDRLLKRTSMSKLIEANTILTNRLDFLAALRQMVLQPKVAKLVKERKELHRILEKELWVFGDEYLLLASDKGLDEVLERHLAILRPAGSRKKNAQTPVRRSDGTRGIVDLMLSQQRRGVSTREHLVVELKRPDVDITQKEVGQIKSYAEAVVNDPQFHSVSATWDFWVISAKLEKTVELDASDSSRPPGQIASWKNVRIWAKTWSQLLDENEARLRFFRDALEHDASKEHAVDYIIRNHEPRTIPTPLRVVGGSPGSPPPNASAPGSTSQSPGPRCPRPTG